MEILNQIFLPVSIWFQSSSSWMMSFFKGVTFLGDTEFYLLIMPALFWCIDTTLGIRIGIMLLVSGSLNSLFKFTFQWPRPFWVESSVINQVEATGFGFPSGHAQNAASLWGLLAASLKKGWGRWISLLVIFLIGFSRIVLGVHFTHDVLAGWLVGGALLLLFLNLEKPVIQWFNDNSTGLQILALLFIIFLFLLIAVLIVPPFNPPALPSEWNYHGDPFSYEGLLTTTGSFLGLGLGVILLARTGMFSHHGTIGQKVIRYLVGIVGVLVLYLGLGSIFPDGRTLASYVLRFTRYFLIGFWIAFGAPRVFSWLKLTRETS